MLTVFSAGPDDDRVAPWDADAGSTSRQRMAQRERENEAALALAGARAENAGLRDGVYGGRRPRPRDLRGALTAAARVYVCAGIGLQRVAEAHVLVRDACLRVRPDAVLYADQPYCAFRADVELPPRLADRYLRRVVALDEQQREQKARAIRCYDGELAKLERIFGPFATPQLLPYEVLWEPR